MTMQKGAPKTEDAFGKPGSHKPETQAPKRKILDPMEPSFKRTQRPQRVELMSRLRRPTWTQPFTVWELAGFSGISIKYPDMESISPY